MRKLLLAVCVLLLSTSIVCASEYKVLDQGRTPECTAYAVATYLDIVGEPISANDLYDEVDALNPDNMEGITINQALDYMVSTGAITSWSILPLCDIDKTLDSVPIIVTTFTNVNDWMDGEITLNPESWCLHASVLVGKTSDYLIGVNSWGMNYGFAGKYHLYNRSVIFEAYVIVK